MIDPVKRALAEHLLQLKQHNQPLYADIGRALVDLSDPEMKGLLAAPRDQLEGQQGRARMITELLEVFFRCEEMCRPVPPPARPSPPTGGFTLEGLLQNGHHRGT